MSRIPRIVLDTNVWISGLLSPKGVPAAILKAHEEKRIQLLVSDLMADEVLRVLNYPKIRKYPHVTDDLLRSVAALLLFHVQRVEPTISHTLSPDPDDNMFLDVEVTGRAEAIVTGDKSDLLSLKEIDGIPIVTARQFIEQWKIIK